MPEVISLFAGRPATLSLTLVMLIASITALCSRELYHQWILHPYRVFKRKEILRLATSGFVHNDLYHLFINTIMLVIICGKLEELLRGSSGNGSLLFMIIFLISHFTGVLTVTWTNRDNYDYASAGASGSILGCMMGLMILAPENIAFHLPVFGGVKNQYAALILIVGLVVYRWRSGNELLDNELHFYSALGGIAGALAVYPQLI